MKSLFDFVAVFLITFPAIKPTKRNSVKPRNVIGKCGRMFFGASHPSLKNCIARAKRTRTQSVVEKLYSGLPVKLKYRS